MWNYNLKQGTVWTVKSLNNYDEHYEGMQFGETFILILSIYTDVNGIEKYTYLKLDKVIKNGFYTYDLLQSDYGKFYINYNNINTGDRRGLESYKFTLSNHQLSTVLHIIKTHFSFFNKTKQHNIFQEPLCNTSKIQNNTKSISNLTTVNKYGLEVKFKPSNDVILIKDRFKFSEQFKKDILVLEPNVVSFKYNIYPEQAIRIIKSKLKYVKNHT